MNKKFVSVLFLVAACTVFLVYRAAEQSAKSVVTVQSLLQGDHPNQAVRLGARVTEREIVYETKPALLLKFAVTDPPTEEGPEAIGLGDEHPDMSAAEQTVQIQNANLASLPVVYKGAKPDTLQPGRDVILEGTFSSGVFRASLLLTQCPSKYEPPAGPSGADYSENDFDTKRAG